MKKFTDWLLDLLDAAHIILPLTGVIIMLLLICFNGGGCHGNKQIIDIQRTFNYAIIKLPDGTIVEGEVESWKDYEGEQLQIKINNIIYLTSSFNATLLYKNK